MMLEDEMDWELPTWGDQYLWAEAYPWWGLKKSCSYYYEVREWMNELCCHVGKIDKEIIRQFIGWVESEKIQYCNCAACLGPKLENDLKIAFEHGGIPIVGLAEYPAHDVGRQEKILRDIRKRK